MSVYGTATYGKAGANYGNLGLNSVTLTASAPVKVTDDDLLMTSGIQVTGATTLTGTGFRGIKRNIFATRSVTAPTTPTIRKDLTKSLSWAVANAVWLAAPRFAFRTLSTNVNTSEAFVRAVSSRLNAPVASNVSVPRAMTRTITTLAITTETVARSVRDTMSVGSTATPTDAIRVAKILQDDVIAAPSISRIRSALQTLTAGVNNFGSFTKAARTTVSRTATGAPNLNRIYSLRRVLTTASTASATLSRINSLSRALTTSATASSTFTRYIGAIRAATPSTNASIARRIASSFVINAAASATPTFSRFVRATRSASVTTTGTVAKAIRDTITASSTGAPSLSRTTTLSKLLTATGTATSNFARAVRKTVSFSATGTPSFTLTDVTNVLLTIGASAGVSIQKALAKAFSGSVTGSLGNTISVGKRLSFTSSGVPSLRNAIAMRLDRAVTANATLATVATFLSVTYNQTLSVSSAIIASLRRDARKTLSVTNTPVAANVGQSVQGQWVGNYGATGYVLCAADPAGSDIVNLPSGVSYTFSGVRGQWTSTPPLDPKILETPDESGQLPAAYWHQLNVSQPVFTFANGFVGTFWIYVLDYDVFGPRNENVAVNGVTLNPGNFTQGKWLGWPLDLPPGGTATITVTVITGNDVMQAVALDGPLMLPSGGAPQVTPSMLKRATKTFALGITGTPTQAARAAIVRVLSVAGTITPSVRRAIVKTNTFTVTSSTLLSKLGFTTLSVGTTATPTYSERIGKTFDLLQPVSLPAFVKRVTKTATAINLASTTFGRFVQSTIQRAVAATPTFRRDIAVSRTLGVAGVPATNKSVRSTLAIIIDSVAQIRKALKWALNAASTPTASINIATQFLISTMYHTLSTGVTTTSTIGRSVRVTFSSAITALVNSSSSMNRFVRTTINHVVTSSATNTVRVSKTAAVTQSVTADVPRRVGKFASVTQATVATATRLVFKLLARPITTAPSVSPSLRLIRTLSTVVGILPSIRRAVTRTLSASIVTSTSFIRSSIKPFNTDAVVQPTVTKRTTKTMSRIVSAVADLSRGSALNIALSVGVSVVPSFIRRRTMTLVATIASSVNTTRAITAKIINVVTGSATIRRSLTKTLLVSVTALPSFNQARRLLLSLTSTVTNAVTIRRARTMTLVATVTSNGKITRMIEAALRADVIPSALVTTTAKIHEIMTRHVTRGNDRVSGKSTSRMGGKSTSKMGGGRPRGSLGGRSSSGGINGRRDRS